MPRQRRVDIVVQRQCTVGEDGAAVAILPQGLRIVSDEYKVAIRRPRTKRLGAFTAEALVADLDDLVDQVHVEIDGETSGKGQSGSHPGRISVDRHLEIFAQLREFLDVADRCTHRRTVDPGNKCCIFAPRKGAVKGAPKTERE